MLSHTTVGGEVNTFMAVPRSTEHDQLMNEYVDLWNGNSLKLDVVSELVAVYDPGAPEGKVHGRDAFEPSFVSFGTGSLTFRSRSTTCSWAMRSSWGNGR